MPLRRFEQAIRSRSSAPPGTEPVECVPVPAGGLTSQLSESKLSAEGSAWQRGFINVTRSPAYRTDALLKRLKKHEGQCLAR